MRNKRKSHPANGLQKICSIKPCKVRLKRIVWQLKSLQNINENIHKTSRRQLLAANENTTLNTKKPLIHKSVLPQEKNLRKSLLNISNTYKTASIYNKKSIANQPTDESIESTISNGVQTNNGITSTQRQSIAKGKKVKTLSQQKEKAGNKKQVNNLLTKTKQKRIEKDKLTETATNEMSNKLPKTTTAKFMFAEKKFKKLCENKFNVDGEQNKNLLRNNSVYEFHSQSTIYTNSRKREDPYADIVSKLIKEGKVRVATCAKGKGKPIVKRGRHKQNTLQKKVRFDNETKAQTINAKSSAKIKRDTNHNICGQLIDNNKIPDGLKSSGMKAINASLLPLYQQFEKNTSFSPLAQLVLRKQANKFNNITEPALQTVQQHPKSISTPIKENTDPPINFSYALSPIRTYSHAKQQRQQQKQISYLSSPWRVNHESMNLPTVFNFNLTSDCSPSFSSDFIIPQISRENPGNEEIAASTSSNTAFEKVPITAAEKVSEISANAVQDDGKEQNRLVAEIIEDMENLPPPASLDTFNSSLDVLNSPKAAVKTFRDLNSLENTTQHRLPLKPINILNVVELPPWNQLPITKATIVNNEKISNCDLPNNNTQCDASIERMKHCQPLMNISINTDKQRTQKGSFTDSPLDVSNNIEEHEEHSLQSKSSSRIQQFENSWQYTEIEEEELSENEENIKLYGFEEYFQSIAQQPNKEIVLNIRNNECDKRSLHEKLCDLKKFRPRLHPSSSCSTATITNFPRRNLFDCNLKQKKIDELFHNQNIRNMDKSKAEESFIEANCMAELFSNEYEIEPEVVNKKEIKRNYVKGWKRRPRLIEKQYTICLDSDESEDEWNANMKPSPKKRGQQKAKKENPELTRYVKSFNEMCNEVEKFDLIIEKDNLV